MRRNPAMQRTVMAFESMNLLPATSPDAIFSASYCNTPEDIILLWRAARPPPLVIRVPNLRNNIFFRRKPAGCKFTEHLGSETSKTLLHSPYTRSLLVAFSIEVQDRSFRVVKETPTVQNSQQRKKIRKTGVWWGEGSSR